LSIVQINPLRPSSGHSATESQSLLFSAASFKRLALAGTRKPRCRRLCISFQFDALASRSQGESLHHPLDRNLGRYVRRDEQKHSSLAGSQTVFSSPQPATPLSQLSELIVFRQIISFSHGIIIAVIPNKASLSH